MPDALLSSYRRFFGFHRWAAKHLDKFSAALELTARAGALIHPGRKPGAHAQSWPKTRWDRYIQTTCAATALMYRLPDLPKFLDIRWHDPDGVLENAKRDGGPILTYHHPFAYHFPALLGHAGLSLDVLALSPEESPLYPLYEEYVAKWFSDCERLQTGTWFFLRRDRPNNMRPPLHNLRQGRAMISLHDFPNFYKDARSCPAHLLGREFNAPEGIIGPAVRMKLPVAAGYIEWPGGNTLDIHLFSLNAHGTETLAPDEILDRYFEKLEALITKCPTFWEAWANLPPPANAKSPLTENALTQGI